MNSAAEREFATAKGKLAIAENHHMQFSNSIEGTNWYLQAIGHLLSALILTLQEQNRSLPSPPNPKEQT